MPSPRRTGSSGRPNSSNRTLLDLQPGSLRMAWSDDDLTRYPFASFKTPPTQWDMRGAPQPDGRPFPKSRWTRLDAFLPAVLVNVYESPLVDVRLEVIGCETAVTVRIEVSNRDTKPHTVQLRCDSANWGADPAWVDHAVERRQPRRRLEQARRARVLVVGIGAGAYSLQSDGRARGRNRW